MTKDEALRLALEALELVSIEFVCNSAHHAKKDRHEWLDPCPIVDRYKEAITAIKAALEAKDEIDWKDMYEKEKRRSEMWVAKYEKDIGPLEKAVPQQEAKDEPVAWIYKGEQSFDGNKWSDEYELTVSKQVALWKGRDAKPLYTTPPQRKPLTDEEIENAIDAWFKPNSDGTYGTWHERMRAAIKAAHGIKGEA